MFGKRPDGKAVGKELDPIIRLTSYLMPQRCDAQVFHKINIPSAPVDAFVKKHRQNGLTISPMTVFISAYIRAIHEMPSLNRFVVNKMIYDRNELAVSFVILKANSKEESKETAIKLFFESENTIYDVADKVNTAIEDNRAMDKSNKTDAFANMLLSMPALTNFFIKFIMFLDRYGLLPKKIIDISPFHTSLFISNMASIGMGDIYHHIYNFGTTSYFLGMGAKERRFKIQSDGSTRVESVYPVGVVIDERIASGAQYALFFGIVKRYLKNPELLEVPLVKNEAPHDTNAKEELLQQ